MAAAIPQFDDTVDTWNAFKIRLEAFFEGNDLIDTTSEKKRRALLISALSTRTITVLSSRCVPQKLNELTYSEVVQLLNDHFDPKPNEIAQSYKFFTRNQLPEESVTDFIVAVRRVADSCNFGQALDRMLRDRIVCGLRNPDIRRTLLARSSLTLKEAEEVALSSELAALHVRFMEQSAASVESVDQVHALRNTRSPSRHQGGRQTSASTCSRCGDCTHASEDCPYRNAICRRCKKRGHLARKCPQHRKSRQGATAHCQPDRDEDSAETGHPEGELFTILSEQEMVGAVQMVKPLWRTFECGGIPLTMQLDTGAPVSIITSPTYLQYKDKWPELSKSNLRLSCFLGQLPIQGELRLQVSFGSRTVGGVLAVLDCPGPNLCGRDLISAFNRLGVPVLHSTAGREDKLLHVTSAGSGNGDVKRCLKEYEDLFKPGLGLLKGQPVRFHLKERAVPKFVKARPVPYALRNKVTEELDRLVSEGVLSPVASSEWATPLVPVVKRNGGIRLCADFKVTLNSACHTELYPLPRIEDIFANLGEGEVFSTIDLKDAYNQVPLDEVSKMLTVVNTHKGLFCFNRLPFGVSSAPAIFQRRMETILQGLPGVQVYLDDVIVAEKKSDCNLLEQVMQRFRKHGVKLNPEKCKFRQPRVQYLGHIIDEKGLHPDKENIAAILKVPRPSTVTELKSFLGFLMYYNRFLPGVAALLAPLYELLRKGATWRWGAAQEEAFRKVKEALHRADLLVHYDPKRPVRLECDASQDGIGAVLSHRIDGEDYPIAFRSRTLSAAERNYSQLEKEALALVYGVVKFRQFLLGRTFTLVTDHKPLVGLFHRAKPVPATAAARIQRWALLLSAYSYDIEYKPGLKNVPADALSRLARPRVTSEEDKEGINNAQEYVLLTEHLDNGLVSAKQLAEMTACDTELKQVQRWVQNGWPHTLRRDQGALQPYFVRKNELAVSHGLVYWGHRVVVPQAARKRMLPILHETHQGASAMKSLARTMFWYPGLDKDIEIVVRMCTVCAQAASMPHAQPPMSWPASNEPWGRIHVDFAGPMDGHIMLIVVDSHSKWIEVVPMRSTSSIRTIEELRTLFSRFGLPRTLVSDNGPQFVSEAFDEFMRRNGVVHLRSAPYHPQSNGLAERAVRTVKNGLKKITKGTISARLARMLHRYRRTPLRCGQTPAMLLFGREIRSGLDNLIPKPREQFGKKGIEPKFYTGQPIWMRNYGQGDKWTPGVVRQPQGSRMVTVGGPDGEVIRHHDQLRSRLPVTDETPGDTGDPEPAIAPSGPSGSVPASPAAPHDSGSPTEQIPSGAEPLRRSTRNRRPPDRYQPK